MKKVLTVLVFLTGLAAVARAETFNLNTYYPSPFGSYDRLRLVPRATAPVCTSFLEGLIYYDDIVNQVNICQDDGTWGPVAGLWSRDAADNIFLTDTLSNPNLQVGIGTVSPDYPLTLEAPLVANAALRWTNPAERGAIYFFQNNEFYGSINAYGSNYVDARIRDSLGLTAEMNDEGFLFFRTRTNNIDENRMNIINNGNVGINTTTPGSRLEIAGGTSAATASALNARNAAGTSLLYVRNDGRVGIGTTAPASRLHIAHTGGVFLTAPVEFRLENTTPQGSSQILLEEEGIPPPDGFRIRYNSRADSTRNGLEFIAYNDEINYPIRMRIERDNGRVGIGTAAPTAKLHIEEGTINPLLIEDQLPSDPTPLIVTGIGRLGVGVTSPAAKLDVGGSLKIGYDSDVCDNTTAGSLRYVGGFFEGCNGTAWISVSSPKIIYGAVRANGSAAYGTGFSSARLGLGRYRVNFNVPFANIPSVIIPKLTPTYTGYEVRNLTAIGFDLITEDVLGNSVNHAFNFSAM